VAIVVAMVAPTAVATVIEPFELQWMGSAAEHHFRKVRPAIEELPWGSLDPTQFDPGAVMRARIAWTEVAVNEYRAAAAFTEVLRALIDAKAPLDLIGMTSDFLADECSHVEMASRLAMELGGGVKRLVDLDRFAVRPRGLTPLQRANELVLRVSCVAEAFSGGTAAISHRTTTQPLPSSVYEAILRDEALHRRLGGLYFEWALPRIDDAERLRLCRVLFDSLRELAPFWRVAEPGASVSEAVDPQKAEPQAPSPWIADLEALGWLEAHAFEAVARDVVAREILDALATIGIEIAPEERESILGK
jgi:hypothetical protein